MSGIVFSKESSRVEATLDCRLFAVPGRAHYIPRLGFSLQDALMDGRTPHVRPVSTQHPSPSIWTPRGGQGEGGSVKRVSHLEESLDKALCRAPRRRGRETGQVGGYVSLFLEGRNFFFFSFFPFFFFSSDRSFWRVFWRVCFGTEGGYSWKGWGELEGRSCCTCWMF